MKTGAGFQSGRTVITGGENRHENLLGDSHWR
jgi:hypothetical protein